MSDQLQTFAKGYIASNRYEVVRQLGSGGMGSVYEAFDRHIEKRVAIKFLDPMLTDNKEFVKRFKREAVAAAGLHHENICGVTDHGVTDDNVPFLVMEYLEGEALTELFNRSGHIEPHVAVEIMLQVLEALGVVHESGIVHRDLKPDNIFLTRTARGKLRPKLIDFGIAKLSDATGTKTAFGRVMGTVYYMSPEQAEGAVDQIDHRTDLWSIGVILYEALTGKLPFTGDTLREVMGGILFKHPPTPTTLAPGVPPALSAVIEKSMAKEKDARFTDAFTFAAALEAALGVQAPAAALPPDRATGPTLTATPAAPTGTSQPMMAPVTGPQQAVGWQQNGHSHDNGTSSGGLAASGATSNADHALGSSPSMTSLASAELHVASQPASSRRLPLIIVGVVVALIAVFGLGGTALFVFTNHEDENVSLSRSTVAPTATPPPSPTTTPGNAIVPPVETQAVPPQGTVPPTATSATHTGVVVDAGAATADAEAELLEIEIQGLPENATATFAGQNIEEGLLRGTPGTTGELVVNAEGYRELRREVLLTEDLELDLGEDLERLEEASAERTSSRAQARRRHSRRAQQPARSGHEPNSSSPRSSPWPHRRSTPGNTGVVGGWESRGRGSGTGVAGGWE